MRDLLVRVYRVGMRDAVLIAVPEPGGGRDAPRHILLDFGDVLPGRAGQDGQDGHDGGGEGVIAPVMDDLTSVLDGRPLDLYVMSRERPDGVEDLVHAASAGGKRIDVRQAWLTASAAPDYHDRFPEARRRRLAALAVYRAARRQLHGARSLSPLVDALLADNDARRTGRSVRFVRGQLTDPAAVRYVHRGADVSDVQPARGATLSVWAPEEDTSVYFGRFASIAGAAAAGAAAGGPADDQNDGEGGEGDVDATDGALPVPPGGVDAGAFYNLIESRRAGGASALLRIDRARNNTSVVLCLEWSGWRLLFAGDAEVRSWRMMVQAGVIEPVHFLKVSQTGMPPRDVLDRLLPPEPPDDRPRRAVLSAHGEASPGVRDAAALATLRERTELRSTTDLTAPDYKLDFRFPARPARSRDE